MAKSPDKPTDVSIPKHIGIIMDGNGRWAKKKLLPRIVGHQNGVRSVRACAELSAEWGVEVLTLYSFSTENWTRPKEEVSFLMKLFKEFLIKEVKTMMENNIVLKTIGRRDRIPDFLKPAFEEALEKTSSNTGMKLCLAFDYGSQTEIINAVKTITKKAFENQISLDQIDENLINQHLYTNEFPELDLIIRTSGEKRLSNFLLWQAAYSEFYFTETLWPDFGKPELAEAIVDFSKRQRRRGGV